MKNRLSSTCLVLMLCGFPFSFIHAQELTGIWRGHFRSNDAPERLAGNYDDRYKIEVQIAQTRNHFEAITYSYKSTEFYGKAEASGSINAQSRRILLKEGKLLEVRYVSGSVCVMTCLMQYSRLGNDEYLEGTYYSTSVNDSTSNCGKGSIFLHRVVESDFHKEPFLVQKEKELLAHKKEQPSVQKSSPAVAAVTIPKPAASAAKKTVPKTVPAAKQPAVAKNQPASAQRKSMQLLPQQSQKPRDSAMAIIQPAIPVPIPAVIKERRNELLKTLTVNNKTIELRIYDDGAIDNDTVSVYYDNKLIVSKARLSDQPITVMIDVEPSDLPHQLVMVAENLGDIPPNTSLLVVRDGEKKYEERIISDEQKNVVVNFIYKKIE